MYRRSGNCNLSNCKLTQKRFRVFNGIRTHGLCVRAALLYQLSCEDPYIGSRQFVEFFLISERSETQSDDVNYGNTIVTIMAADAYTCAAQVSPLPYGFCWSYSRLIIRKSMGKDIAYARRPVEGYEFAAWKFFKSPISQLSATSGNHHFVPTRHRNFNSSRGFITGLLLLCGDIFSQPGPRITKRTQNSGSSVPLKGLVINARSMKSTHKVGTSRVNNLDRVQDLVCSEHADIVLISETWLNGNILVQEFFPLSDLLVYR